MRLVTFLFLPCALLLSACSVFPQGEAVTGSGTVSIRIPAAVQLLALDNRETEAPSLYTGYYRLLVTPGEHTLALRYEQNWNDMEEAGHIVRSEPVSVRAEFRAQESYEIQLPAIADRRQAEHFAATPEFILASSQQSVASEPLPGPLVTAPADADLAENMKALWQSASADEKRRFRLWLEQQP